MKKINIRSLLSKLISLKRSKKYLIWLVVLVLLFSYFLIFPQRLKITLAFLKGNVEWFFLLVSVLLSAFIFASHWNFAGGKSWLWRKLAFVLLLTTSLLTLIFSVKIRLSEVEKIRIVSQNKESIDSVKRSLKSEYRISEKKLKNKNSDLEENLANLKKSFDSLLSTKSQTVSFEEDEKQSDLSFNNDSLVFLVKSLKDDISSLKKPKTVVVTTIRKSYKKKPVKYTPPGTIRYTGRKY